MENRVLCHQPISAEWSRALELADYGASMGVLSMSTAGGCPRTEPHQRERGRTDVEGGRGEHERRRRAHAAHEEQGACQTA